MDVPSTFVAAPVSTAPVFGGLHTRAGRVLALTNKPPPPGSQRVAFIVELGDLPAKNPCLEWSWNRDDWDFASGRLKPGCGEIIPLRRLPHGEYGAPIDLPADRRGADIFWDVKADIPKGNGESLNFDEDFPKRTPFHEALQRFTLPLDIGHRMGCRAIYPTRLVFTDDPSQTKLEFIDEVFGKPQAEFRRYEPGVEWVALQVIDRRGNVAREYKITQQDPEFEEGMWSLRLPDFMALKKDFAYRWRSPATVHDESGIDEWNPAVPWFTNWCWHFVNPNTGDETNEHGETEGKADKAKPVPFLRVDVQEDPTPHTAYYLTFRDEAGELLSEKALRARLGALEPELAQRFIDGRTYRDDQGRPFNGDEIREYVLAGHPRVDELALHHLDEENGVGRVRISPREGALNTFLHNPEALVGLTPRIVPYDQGADGVWRPAEGRAHRYNTTWGGRIERHTGRGLFASAIDQPRFIHGPNDVWEPPAPPWREQTEVTEVVQTEAIYGGAGATRRSTAKDLIERHVPYLVEQGKDVSLHTPNHPEGVNRGHRYDIPRAQGMDPSYSDWLTQPAEARHQLSAKGLARARRMLAKTMGMSPDDPAVTVTLKTKVEAHRSRPPRDYLRSADAGWARYVNEAHRAGKKVGFDLEFNHFFHGDNFYDRPVFHNWHADPSRGYSPHDSRFGLVPAVGNFVMGQVFQYNVVQAVRNWGVDLLRADYTGNFTPPGDDEESRRRRAVGEQFLRRINSVVHAFSPAKTVGEHFKESRYVTDPVVRGTAGLGFDRAVYNRTFFEGVQRFGENKEGILRAAGAQARRNREVPANMRRQIEDFANAIAFVHDSFGDWRRAQHELGGIDLFKVEGTLLTNAEDHQRAPFPSDPARSMARAYYAATMLLPGWVSTRRGPLDRNYGHDGPISASDSGQLQWRLPWRSRPEFDLGELELNEAAVPEYLRLAGLSPRERRKACEGLPFERREAIEFLAGLPKWKRMSGLVAIVQNQHLRLERDVVALRHSSPAFSAGHSLSWLDKPGADDPPTTLQYFRRGPDHEYLVILSLHPQALTNYFVDYARNYREVFNSNARLYGGTGLGNNGALFHGATTLTVPAWSTIVMRTLSDEEAEAQERKRQ